MLEAIMNSELNQTPLANFDRETVDEVPANPVGQSKGGRANGEIVAAKSDVTDVSQMYSERIGAAGLISLIGVGAFSLLYIVALLLANPPVSPGMAVVDFLHYLLVIGATAGAAVFVTRRMNAPRQQGVATGQIGPYRLVTLLGRGGMGEVYLAEHRRLQRPCAIKLIRPDRIGDAQVVARFEREVCMTARLSHWNTVEVFDYGRTDDGTFYYVMEYLPGMSLEEMLQTHRRQPAQRVVHFLRQACQALREAHSIGLIHRDITPGNLFAARRGGMYDVIKVLDFGLVKSAGEMPEARLTQQGTLSGTPLIMSPEQARGIDDVDRRSDIYSLGAVAYTLLTGRPPFERSNPMDVLMAHVLDLVTPPSELWADVPVDLEEVVLRCLAKKPEDRYQDMDDLEQALSRCAAAGRWTQASAESWWRENTQESPPLDRFESLVGALGNAC
jgi:serine/threonine-protein kinase